ncbi:glutamate--tRNA ligase [Mechercharimyces sp. CAU 1602]|uniref:glutamate--tRNA ligase n=1 Tax=Mechercharimyces sp. CAU 1602 TaxID=2973933 RepID=UPI0021615757|nr:glutamate--tRNA ligase [Mechercharimyces sp. CAU 1602]MCS1352511.1 glutamate--tRNA ligase [Mechercharimyces sp. CAU 1602]
MATRVRTRYAPSPTGHLHIGGARTALFSYLWARKFGGDFVVRIEDTDSERNMEQAAEKQMAALAWLGIEWDESVDREGDYGPYRSMERVDIYKRYVNQLVEQGDAYACYCTSAELEQDRERQLAAGIAPKYSKRCRHLTVEETKKLEAEGRTASIRFRVPEGESIVVDDLVRGQVSFESDGIGDFILVRPDGRPTYNFAVTVDDALMKISHVVRGEEHLSNTPRQIMIYRALGWETPRFAHAALILNPDGKKMSKRDEAIVQFIDQYRDLGYLPEALINFISLLGWSPEGEDELFSKEELIERFSLERVSKAPAVFDTGKLNYMNNYYIKQSPLERIVALALPFLEEKGKISLPLPAERQEWVTRVVALYQEQLDYVAQIPALTEMFFRAKAIYSAEAQEVLAEEQVPEVLRTLKEQIEGLHEALTADNVKVLLKQVQKETGHKGKKLFMPVRAAVTGEVHGPDLKETMSLLGKECVLERLQHCLDN